MSDERWRRREPERTGPRRNFGHVLRRPSPGEARSLDGDGRRRRGAWDRDPRGGETWRGGYGGDEDVREEHLRDEVDEGVRSAYRVLDEQIRRGERIAREQTERLYSCFWGDPRSGGGGLGNRPMRSYSDGMLRLWTTWLELGTAFFRMEDWAEWWGLPGGPSPWGAEPPPRPMPHPPHPPHPDEPPVRRHREPAVSFAVEVEVEVVSSRPTRVRYDLTAEALERPVEISPLQSRDRAAVALEDVQLVCDDVVSLLRVKVPDDQPVGRYHGVVVDAAGGELRGTVSVEVLEP